MAEPVRARRLTGEEGQRLLQIVRGGKHGSVRVRRAMIIVASASGTLVPAIARLVAADEDTVRDVIHAFDEKGLAALDPRWAGGGPRLIGDGDIEVIVAAARTGPEKPGLRFTHWGLRELAGYLAGRDRPVRVGRERLRQILHERGISFQRTRTWKESHDRDRDAMLDRIEYVTGHYPDWWVGFDQFGPLWIRPCHGVCWAPRKRPVRQRARRAGSRGVPAAGYGERRRPSAPNLRRPAPAGSPDGGKGRHTSRPGGHWPIVRPPQRSLGDPRTGRGRRS
jgi:transposase